MKTIPCYVVGSGGAAHALVSALAIVEQAAEAPKFEIRRLSRGEPLPQVTGEALLLIANPHALHSDLIIEGERKGFTHIVTEKPAAVSLEQIERLSGVRADVAVCHGYRQQWGPRKIKAAIASGELGRVISVEGRYWQSSAAASGGKGPDNWKNHPELSGPHDVLLDLGTHWADLVQFVLGKDATRARAHLSYVNSEAAHRDTHVLLEMTFPEGVRSWGSVSKTVHGAGNHLELVVLGEKASLRWNFERPDELWVGKGRETVCVLRPKEEKTDSAFPPNHGLGWLDGYVSILSSVVHKMQGRTAGTYATLKDSLKTASLLLTAEK